ncbi:MAG: hypothetical protein PVH18_04010, partial [Chloroflexota bacterium]|jgi:GGDEF domain-containing protein
MRASGWTYTELAIMNMQPFVDAYGFVAGDEVLRFAALTIGETIDRFGTSDDFIGQATSDAFVVITYADNAHELVREIQERFSDAIGSHYNFLDSERGGIVLSDGSLAPLMWLAAGTVSDQDGPFTDIREITEAAAVARRADSVS